MGRRVVTAKTKKPKGPSAQYVSRAGALKRTQLNIADFRRLCILKGIYPRVPKRKLKGNNATYYHLKDISSLNRDRLMPLFRQEKAHQKKIRRAKGRDELSLAKHYRSTKPCPTLDHIVKQRYPTLMDAVRDLDDPLSTLALFAALPTNNDNGLTPKAITHSTQLLDEFHFFVCTTGSLRKIFASIKGFYLQANILGQSVTWLVPHQYTQDLPAEVDYKVLLTFQELYDCITKFVNFKLYTMTGIQYPPKPNQRKRKLGLRHLAFSEDSESTGTDNESVPVGDTAGTDTEGRDVEMTVGEENKNPQKANNKILRSSEAAASIFHKLIVFLSREVPLGIMSIALISGGATICWDDAGSSPVDVEDPSITHQVVDRPAEHLESFLSQSSALPPREYVQPQWVLDCVNTGTLLPTEPYRPGARPPPHLSPFVNDEAEGYIPDQRSVLDKMAAHNDNTTGSKRNTTGTGMTDGMLDEDEDSVDTAEVNAALAQQYEMEIEAERKGEWFSQESAVRISAAIGGAVPDAIGDLRSTAIAAAGDSSTTTASKRSRRIKMKAKDEEERRAALLSNRKRKLKTKLESDKEVQLSKAKKLEDKKRQRKANVDN